MEIRRCVIIMSNPIKIDQRYQLIKNLGGGLSGDVMLVQDNNGQKTALKFLKKIQMNVSREEALQNFKNEFEILKQLNHPNISRILDFGFDNKSEKYYFTCEFIQGAEFHNACKDQPMESIERLIVQVLRALNYLHSKSIFHFDIKPQNILVKMNESVPETAKIIDFGLAGYGSPRKRVGTPAFMAPEVIQGGVLDGRTDLYSTGVMIYTVLTGVNPFSDKNLKVTLENQIKMIPLPPSKINPQVPEYWDHIVMRMLEKDPINRYSQASLAIRDLNFLSNKKFDIETNDTKLSYLPEKGSLIGRDQEWKSFTELFGHIFVSDKIPDEKVLIIEGAKGTGKTRLISEAKYYAQLRKISVKTLSQFESENSDTPFLMLIDSGQADMDQVNTLLQQVQTERYMIVWATENPPKNWANSRIIQLQNYSKDQLKSYLESVTGLSSAPPQLIDEVYQRTLGNPLFVSEFIKSLLEQGFLYDASGQWDATTFKDIKINFDRIHIPNSVEEFLRTKFNALNPEKQNLLKYLAVHHAPLNPKIIGIYLKNQDLSGDILDLMNDDILERISKDNSYYFKNLLFANVIYDSLTMDERQNIHSDLASAYLGVQTARNIYLFHKGHSGHDSECLEALYELADNQIDLANDEDAIENLQSILNQSENLFGDLEIKAKFKMGRALMNRKRFDEATVLYESFLEHYQNSTQSDEIEYILKAYIKLTDITLKKTNTEKAMDLCNQAVRQCQQSLHKTMYEVIFNNYKAYINMKQGHYDIAETIYLESHRTWQDQLNEEEKKSADNNRLVEVYLMKKEYEKAIEICNSSIENLKRYNNRYLLAFHYYALGDIYSRYAIEQGVEEKNHYLEKTIYNLEACEAIAREIHDYGLMLRAFNGLGNIYTFRKQSEQALDYYKRALAVAQKSEDYFNAALISYNVAGIALRLNDIRDSFCYLIYTINTLENLKENRSPHKELNLFLSYAQLADVYLKKNDTDKADEFIQKADVYFHSTEILKSLEFWLLIRTCQIRYKQNKLNEADQLFKQAKLLAKDQEEKEEIETTNKEYIQPLNRNASDLPRGVKIMSQTTKATSQDDLKKIIEINKFINSESNPEQLLKVVLNYALQLTTAESGFVMLLDEDDSFVIKARMNTSETDEEKISMSIARLAIEQGEIITSSDALTDDRFDSSESIVMNELKSVLCLPIRSHNRSIGVFYLDNRFKINAFESTNLDLLNAFCDQVGIALEKTNLISQLMSAQNKLAHQLKETKEELHQVKEILKEESENFKTRYAYTSIISKSVQMQNIFKLLDKITETTLSIFIHGQSGTGKELVAKALHYNNATRNTKRFIAINCGAIPTNLMESELFGHKAGSFTGADKDKKGLFEEANGGTLFLDEIGELDSQLQVKLLRVLQEGEVQRIGDSNIIKVNVRIISASHKDIEKMVKENKFREDLYYRLCQMKIDLPPLKDRTEDIPLLAKHFVQKFSKQNDIREEISIPPQFMKAMLEYEWPGNVRELENLISVACALRDEYKLSLDLIPPDYGIIQKLKSSNSGFSLQQNLADTSTVLKKSVMIDDQNEYDHLTSWPQYESIIIAKAYEDCERKKVPTADALDLSHSTIYKKISDLNLDDTSNPLYASTFKYIKNTTMKQYILRIFEAALIYHDQHPYAAIKQLGVSQGYFYKIMKEFKSRTEDSQEHQNHNE